MQIQISGTSIAECNLALNSFHPLWTLSPFVSLFSPDKISGKDVQHYHTRSEVSECFSNLKCVFSPPPPPQKNIRSLLTSSTPESWARRGRGEVAAVNLILIVGKGGLVCLDAGHALMGANRVAGWRLWAVIGQQTRKKRINKEGKRGEEDQTRKHVFASFISTYQSL